MFFLGTTYRSDDPTNGVIALKDNGWSTSIEGMKAITDDVIIEIVK